VTLEDDGSDEIENYEERHDAGFFKPGDVVRFTDVVKDWPGTPQPGQLAVVAEVGDPDSAPYPLTVDIRPDGDTPILGLPVLAKEIQLVNRPQGRKLRRRFPWL
jgi:hypothetical protein